MKALICFILIPKCRLQMHSNLVVTAENLPISDITILIFLCIFNTFSPSVTFLFWLRRAKKKQPCGQIEPKCVLELRVTLLRVKQNKQNGQILLKFPPDNIISQTMMFHKNFKCLKKL